MAIRYIRIGSMEDVHAYDDLDYDSSIETDGPISAGEPVDLDHLVRLQDLSDHILPPGVILMWSGAVVDIPTGWLLCDGTGGTPDLRGQFIIGAGGAYAVGSTGGNEDINLTVNQLPSHDHGGTTGNHTCVSAVTPTYVNVAAGADENVVDDITVTDTPHNHSISATGAGADIDIRPPYYALCFIMRDAYV